MFTVYRYITKSMMIDNPPRETSMLLVSILDIHDTHTTLTTAIVKQDNTI